MALRPAGSASKIALLFSSLWTIVMLLALIAGHLIVVISLFLYLDQGLGMEKMVEETGLSMTILWGLIAVSVLLDGWIFISGKKNKENIRRR